MAVNLKKGGSVSLTKGTPGLKRILVGLGWQEKTTGGEGFDLDASAFLLTKNGKVRTEGDFVFYGQLISQCGSVKSMGDDRTGGGGDDDNESLEIELEQVPNVIERIVVIVTIYEAENRRQNFGQVGSAFMRIVNLDNNTEIARFDLAEDFGTETAIIFGEIYKDGSDWKFKAVGQGFPGGLAGMCKQFGVAVAS